MPDVQELFRMSAQKVRQDPGALERQQARQRRRDRNRRMGAFALVAALGIAVAVFAAQGVVRDDRSRPATDPTSTPTPEPAVTNPPQVDYLLDLETGETTPLPESIRGDWQNGYAISPDGSVVAYYGRAKDGNPGVFVAHLDGTQVRQITDDVRLTMEPRSPGWSPDGTKIAYVGRPDGDPNSNIFVAYLTNGVATQVTLETVEVSGSVFSPDGSSIVYSAGIPDGEEVRIVPATGGRGSRLVGGDGTDARGASLSPDGSLLSYICDGKICLALADGSDVTGSLMDAECKQYLHIDSCVIVSGGPWSGINTASWSPDGSRLAYWTAFPSNVYVLDVATGESTLVGKEGAWPSWLDNDTLFVEM